MSRGTRSTEQNKPRQGRKKAFITAIFCRSALGDCRLIPRLAPCYFLTLLRSYSDERQAIAAGLIDFDREFAAMISAPPRDPTDPNSKGVDPAEFQRYFVMQGRFTAGTATRYTPSLISGEPAHQHLATGLPIGMRFHSAPVIRLVDAKPMQLGHTVKADGRWRIFAFADSASKRCR